MSLHARFVSDVPEETQRVARAAFRRGNQVLQMRDELGTIFTVEQFGDLFHNVRQPAETPCRLTLVTVLQFCENLTDRHDSLISRLPLNLREKLFICANQ